MKVESAEQGVAFEWEGEPSSVVQVVLLGETELVRERLRLLKEVIRGSREVPVGWTDLELRERRRTVRGVVDLSAGIGLSWKADFLDWQTAALAFTVLCSAVGLSDDTVELDVTM